MTVKRRPFRRGSLPAYHSIKSLGDDILLGIEARLLDGDSGARVCAWLQDEMQVLADVLPGTLKKTLERYRSKELRQKTIKKIAEAQRGVTLRTVTQHFNAITELEALAIIQRARVDKMLAMEKDKPMILKVTSDEIRLLKETLVSLGDMQMDTGLLTRAGKGVGATPVDRMATAQVFTWDDARQQLYEEMLSEQNGSEAA